MLLSPSILGGLFPLHTPIAPTGFPGQPGNPVGFAAAPSYTGSLTPHSGSLVSGTSGAHQVYTGLDFNAGTSGTAVSSKTFIDFVGCRFQSNSLANFNVELTGSSNITFTYCTFGPLASFATAPPGGAWPSAGAPPATPTTSFITGTNCLNGSDGYQFGCNILSGGPVTWQSCDFWGFGQNGPGFFSTTAQMICNNCWIHDACNASPQSFHTDGLGYQNGGVGPTNVTITNCTIASIGNTNGIAWQSATGGYSNIVMSGNYLSGYGYQTALSTTGNMTNTTFTNNTFGTDIPWIFGPLYNNYTTMFSGNGNVWSGNKIHVVAGTSPWSGSDLAFTSGDNGKFIWPDTTLHTSDFVG